MQKNMLHVLVASILVSVAFRAHAVAIVQDSCQTFQNAGSPASRVFFSIVNSNSPPVFRATLQPAGTPPDARCSAGGERHPFLWDATVVSGRVTFATSFNPVFAGTVAREFALETGIAPFCCYEIQFFDQFAQLIDSRTQCLLCSPPSDAAEPPVPPAWTLVKSIYR